MTDNTYGAVLTGLLALAVAKDDSEAEEVLTLMKPYALQLSKIQFDSCREDAERLLVRHPELLMQANTDVLLNLTQIIKGATNG